MGARQAVAAGTPWGEAVGYSRAVRVGRYIAVSGTAAADEGGVVHGKGDAQAQARYILSRIEGAIAQLGGSLSDVVRTRIYVTDMENWEPVGRAHGEVFGRIRPCTSLVEVSKLISPDLLVEIEAEAILGD